MNYGFAVQTTGSRIHLDLQRAMIINLSPGFDCIPALTGKN
jgi:hypothetical protein